MSEGKQEAREQIDENYVVWLRSYKNGPIQTCDSDAPGAFRAYRESYLKRAKREWFTKGLLEGVRHTNAIENERDRLQLELNALKSQPQEKAQPEPFTVNATTRISPMRECGLEIRCTEPHGHTGAHSWEKAQPESRGHSYAHMCRDEHVEIGHNDSEHELCPLCRAINECDAAFRRGQQAMRKQIRAAIISDQATGAGDYSEAEEYADRILASAEPQQRICQYCNSDKWSARYLSNQCPDTYPEGMWMHKKGELTMPCNLQPPQGEAEKGGQQ